MNAVRFHFMTKREANPSRSAGLKGRRILIVEDEFIIADDLAAYFTRLGADVIGPAGSLAEGLALSRDADAAVLDVNLRGEAVFPLAEALLERQVPFVFFTAHAGIGVPSSLVRVERFMKPVSYGRVGLYLERRLVAPEEGEDDELVRLLPKLRIAARLLVRDAHAADRLVERALERAVETLCERDRSMPLEEWIVSILRATAESDDRWSMN